MGEREREREGRRKRPKKMNKLPKCVLKSKKLKSNNTETLRKIRKAKTYMNEIFI